MYFYTEYKLFHDMTHNQYTILYTILIIHTYTHSRKHINPQTHIRTHTFTYSITTPHSLNQNLIISECPVLQSPPGGKLDCLTTSGLAGGSTVGGSTVVCQVVCPTGHAMSTSLDIPARLHCGPSTDFTWPASILPNAPLPSCERWSPLLRWIPDEHYLCTR